MEPDGATGAVQHYLRILEPRRDIQSISQTKVRKARPSLHSICGTWAGLEWSRCSFRHWSLKFSVNDWQQELPSFSRSPFANKLQDTMNEKQTTRTVYMCPERSPPGKPASRYACNPRLRACFGMYSNHALRDSSLSSVHILIGHNPNVLDNTDPSNLITLREPHDAITCHRMNRAKPVYCQPYYLHNLLFLLFRTAWDSISVCFTTRQKLGFCDTLSTTISR